MANTKPARGTRDFLPSDVRKRNYVIGIIKAVYEFYNFEPLETPAIENLETLTGKYGEEGSQLIFKILKRGEKLQEELNASAIKSENDLSDLALRYDLTVPLARVVANHKNDLPEVFSRYQIQPVWRADRPARGRFREFYQCDVDTVGINSMIAEAELCNAVSNALTKLGFSDFVIRLNHRELLGEILSASGIPAEKHNDSLIVVDKLDKIGRDGVKKELLERGVSLDSAERLMKFITRLKLPMGSDTYSKITRSSLSFKEMSKMNLELVSDFISSIGSGKNGLASLKDILQYAEDGNYNVSKVLIDPTLARGLSYYTGAIFEIVLTDGNFAGSIGGGGRYDGLIGMFGKEQIPACGFSLGLERILVVMEERGMFQKLIDEGKLKINSADVLVTIWNAETIGESLKLAAELRAGNLRVSVYPEAAKLGKQFKYADSMKVPFVCVLGETEISENTVTLKNMRTGAQEIVGRDEISKRIKE